jgi:hypothetical protein
MLTEPSYTINEFCACERISRGLLYKLWRTGRGPRFYQVGEYAHRRISHEARLEWQQQREAAAQRELAA